MEMEQKFVAKDPPDLHDWWLQPGSTESTEVHLTLRLYMTLADTEVQATEEEGNETIGRRVLGPLYAEWARCITNSNFPQPCHDTNVAKWKNILDISRPPLYVPSARILELYEARGLARITAVLRLVFLNRGSLEATILGASCWCLLAESEKHVMLPNGKSWPLQRQSDVHAGEAATSQARAQGASGR